MISSTVAFLDEPERPATVLPSAVGLIVNPVQCTVTVVRLNTPTVRPADAMPLIVEAVRARLQRETEIALFYPSGRIGPAGRTMLACFLNRHVRDLDALLTDAYTNHPVLVAVKDAAERDYQMITGWDKVPCEPRTIVVPLAAPPAAPTERTPEGAPL